VTRRWQAIDGAPYPLGVSYVAGEDAFNFALYSKHATEVVLLLYGADDVAKPLRSIALDLLRNRTGRIWHCRVPCAEIADARYYAYSVSDSTAPTPLTWHAFEREKVLLDPYAPEVYLPPSFSRAAARAPGSNAGKAMLGKLCPRAARSERPREHPHHDADLVIYELHVGGFTRHPSSPVAPGHRGTYAGVVDMIPYLVDLGVTAVELMPVFQYDSQSGDYWGYSPVSFFAPHAGYASGGPHACAADELRAMVDALHRADIEVLVDAVYNHTAEGDQRGPVYNFKGIDNSTYYLCSNDPAHPYLDYTGTGNTLHTGNRHVRRMVLDSLRHWATELDVDGFRFDLASIFARNFEGSLSIGEDAAPIFGDIVADPSLATVRLIAEPWDAVGTYQLGRHFPGMEWHQWNGRFRDDVRRFVRGDRGMVPSMMYRIYGSDDLFPESPPDVFHPYQSINFVTAHDGFTLYDLVSYERKHNEANGHGNADGTDESFSCNYGREGDGGVSPELSQLRERQAKNLVAILLLANGTPMLRAGDELLHSQGGNNNPYNQDNDTSWLDWRLRERHRDMHRFVREMIAFRKRHPSLCRSRFWREDVRWFGARGAVDLSPDSHAFAFYLRGAAETDSDLYAMLNMGLDDVTMEVRGATRRWRRAIDTARPPPEEIVDERDAPPLDAARYPVRARSVVVLVATGGGAG